MDVIHIFKIFIYLSALGLSYSTRDLHCMVKDLSLWPKFSLVVGLGLGCLAVREILLPQAGIVPESAASQGGFLTPGPPGKPLDVEL